MTKTLYITIGSSPETNDHVGIGTLHCFGTYTTMDPWLEHLPKEKLVVIVYLRINRIYNTEKFVPSRVFQPLLLTSLTSTSTSTQAFLRRWKNTFHSSIHPNVQTPAAKQQRTQTRPDQTRPDQNNALLPPNQRPRPNRLRPHEHCIRSSPRASRRRSLPGRPALHLAAVLRGRRARVHSP